MGSPCLGSVTLGLYGQGFTPGARLSGWRCGVCRLFLLAAWGVLIAAAVENKYHVSEVPYGQLFMQCSVVSEGLFLSAAVLSAIAAVLMAAYYVYAIRANEELWLCNYVAAPVVVDMEAFSRETARTSITSIIQDKRGEGGKTSAISNTPISHARLA